MSPTPTSKGKLSANGRLAIICAGVFVLMIGAAFAAVPFYRAFCQATGFAGAVPRAQRAPGAVLARRLTVNFDTNVRGLPWRFQAEQRRQTLPIGKSGLAFFTVENTSDHALTGRAVYNVTPDQAGEYMRKLQCFCFNDQTIPAHTKMRFPVVYFVDPGFASDPDTKGFADITLSYTFYPAPAPATKTSLNTSRPLGGSGRAGL
jgi:cytochrome c oxidase assembly protein subunit 11